MLTAVRYLVIILSNVGFGMIAWGIGGLIGWDTPLIRDGLTVRLDVKGAVGIGVGNLAGVIPMRFLFREPSLPPGKSRSEWDDLR